MRWTVQLSEHVLERRRKACLGVSPSKVISSSPSVAPCRFTHRGLSTLGVTWWLRGFVLSGFHFHCWSLFEMFVFQLCLPAHSVNNPSQLVFHVGKALSFFSFFQHLCLCVGEGAQSVTLAVFVVQLRDNSCMGPWVSSRAAVIRLYGYMYGNPSYIPPLF